MKITPPIGFGMFARGVATKWKAFCCTPTVRSLVKLTFLASFQSSGRALYSA